MNRQTQLMNESRNVALFLIVACAAVFLLIAFFTATASGSDELEVTWGIITRVENKSVTPNRPTKVKTYVTLVPYDVDDRDGVIMHPERKMTITVADDTKVQFDGKPGKRSQIREAVAIIVIYKPDNKEATRILIPAYSSYRRTN